MRRDTYTPRNRGFGSVHAFGCALFAVTAFLTSISAGQDVEVIDPPLDPVIQFSEGDIAGASGIGTTFVLAATTECYISGCTVVDAVLRYDGSTGAYAGVHIPNIDDPWGMAIHPIRESLLVISRADATVREYDARTGAFVRILVSPGAEGLHSPQGIVLTSSGRLFVASNQTTGQLSKFNGVIEFNSDTGAFVSHLINGGSSLSETCSNPICLRGPNAMLIGANSRLYVISSINDSVQEFTLNGTFQGAFTSVRLLDPSGMAIRPPGTTNAGNLLVSSKYINPTNNFDDTIVEFNGVTRLLVPTNGGVLAGSLIRPGPLAWHTDGHLLVGERTDIVPPNFAARVWKRNSTTGASLGFFTPLSDTNLHQVTALLHTHVNYATDDSDGDSDTDLRDLAAFQNCFASTSAACLTPFDDNRSATIGRWDFIAFLGNLRGPRRTCTNASQCNDNDVCSVDSCVDGFCRYQSATDGTVCADSLFCNGAETCQSGVCRGTAPCKSQAHCNETTDTCRACLVNSECNDNNPCTDDACSASFTCTFTAHTRTCNDGNVCTTNDRCNAGACVGGPPPNCNDNNVCTTDTCDPTLGCIFTDNLLPCDDGSACTLQDFCLQGTCRAGRNRDCNDNNACTNDSCNAVTGCVYVNNTGTCNDNDPCTENDVCAVGVCRGTQKNCSDSVACTVDRCVNGNCENVADNSRCSNGNWCDGVETCDATLGCQPGTPPCNDGIPCTNDICNPDDQLCTYTPNHALCSNGQFCDGVEQCSPTLGCVAGAPINCNDGVACTADSCDENADTCVHAPNDSLCNDNNICTDDFCEAAGCEYDFNTVPCNDGLLCTINDTCGGGTCSGTPKTCPPGQQCDPADGQCKACLNNSQCNDNNVCTTDTCNAGVCVFTPNSNSCDDGLFCTLTDACSGGTCVGSGNHCPNQLCNETTDTCVDCLSATDCNDNNICTNNVCNNGSCQFPPNTVPCPDGLFCNGDEVCGGGVCQPGTPPDCSHLDGECTDGVCNESTDACVAQPVQNGVSCDDGLFCTHNDKCTGGVCNGDPRCTVAPNLLCDEANDICYQCTVNADCNDGNVCTNDACVSGFCQNTNNNAVCDDGLFCTINDQCAGGSCTGQPRLCTNAPDLFCDENLNDCVECLTNADCNDNNACTTDTCTNGQCFQVNNAQPCNDGLFCTINDTCVGGNCVGSPNDCAPGEFCDEDLDDCVECVVDGHCPNDGNPCTDRACINSTCQQIPNTASCNDGLACTENDRCSGGSCIGDFFSCDDGIPCTVDTCEEPAGCVHTPNHGACDDGLYCTGQEACDAFSGCITTGNPCAPPTDLCNEAIPRCVECLIDQDCPDDGLFCNGEEICDGGVCIHEGDPCIAPATCDENLDDCVEP